MVIEGSHLVHLGHGNIHLFGQCHQMAVMQTAIRIVEHMEQLNQKVTSVRPFAYQGAYFSHRHVVGLSTLELAFTADALAHVVHRA